MQWIKCSDRMPPKDIPFLGYGQNCLDENYEMIVMIWYGGGFDEDGHNMLNSYYALGKWGIYNHEHDCNPIYWMPLPKPPLQISSIIPRDEGFYPPPWNMNEHPEKTEGWIEFQKRMRKDPKIYS